MKLDRGRLNTLLQSRVTLAVLSFFLALGLWVYVVGGRDQSVIREFETRLELLNPPSGMLVTPSTRQITVTLKGERKALAALEKGGLTSDVDLKGLEEGVSRLPVRVPTSGRTEVLQIQPARVEIELVKLGEKKVPFKVKLPAGAPEGFVLSDLQLTPATATVRGRASELNALKAVELRPSLEDLAGPMPLSLTPHLPESLNQNSYEILPSLVRLNGRWGKGQPQENVPVKVNLLGELPGGLELKDLSVEPKEVKVEAPRALFHKGGLTVRTEPLDLSGLTSSGTVTLKLLEPQKPALLLGPREVKVKFDVAAPSLARTFDDLPLKVRGAMKGQERRWRCEPNTVTLRVSFKKMPEELGAASDLGLEAYVDVTNVVESGLRLPVRVKVGKKEFDDLIETVEAEPRTVKVTAEP